MAQAGLSERMPGFSPASVHLGTVVDKVALGQVFLRVFRFSPVNMILSSAVHHCHNPLEVIKNMCTLHQIWTKTFKLLFIITVLIRNNAGIYHHLF
jgi:hypothetical protein